MPRQLRPRKSKLDYVSLDRGEDIGVESPEFGGVADGNDNVDEDGEGDVELEEGPTNLLPDTPARSKGKGKAKAVGSATKPVLRGRGRGRGRGAAAGPLSTRKDPDAAGMSDFEPEASESIASDKSGDDDEDEEEDKDELMDVDDSEKTPVSKGKATPGRGRGRGRGRGKAITATTSTSNSKQPRAPPSPTTLVQPKPHRKSYVLPTPSVNHRHRAVQIYTRKGRVERLQKRPRLFKGPAADEIAYTNPFSSSEKMRTRVGKAWGFNAGPGPIWEIVEDNAWYKEGWGVEEDGIDKDADREGSRRPVVYPNLGVLDGWRVISQQYVETAVMYGD